MSTTTTIASLAAEARDAFAPTAKRDDGTEYEKLRDDAPEWVADLVREVHLGLLPDDWRYACVRSALECVAEADDIEDAAHEWADAYVDVYTAERLEWLASNSYRPEYCDRAVSEYGLGAGVELIERIGYGQYTEAREVYDCVVGFLEGHMAALDAEAPEYLPMDEIL